MKILKKNIPNIIINILFLLYSLRFLFNSFLESNAAIAATWLTWGAHINKFWANLSTLLIWLLGTIIQPILQPVIEKYFENELIT